MGLRQESSLACSINMRGRARGAYTPPHHNMKTLAAASSSRPNSETLAAHVVLAHPCAAFYPRTCGLRGDAAAVAAALISYDDMEVVAGMTTRRRRS
jgi:hypothetical protein